jgi:hypothetical protein
MIKPAQYRGQVDRIRILSEKKGVTIILDFDDSSSLAEIESFYSYVEKGKVLTISVPRLNNANTELLHKIIRKIHSQGELILKQGKEESLAAYSRYLKNNTDKDTLDFFTSILKNPDDVAALKMAFFIRSESKKGLSIIQYKRDIIQKFGDRGANIANLCTAGYFEKEIRPYFMVAPKGEFYDYYEKVVALKARALFIHSSMNETEIEDLLFSMVDKAKKYHMQNPHIHAMGKKNVENIKRFVSKRNEEEDQFEIEKIYEDPKIPAIEYEVII